LEHIARSKLRCLPAAAFALIFLSLSTPATLRAARPVSFNLSTSKAYSPQEKPKIHLYARNVDELEFRIYRIQDPEKFLLNLKDFHSFGNESPWGPKEQIDERTWLEKFHDWKHHLWYLIRQFFRDQYSPASRDALRERQSAVARRSRVVGAAQFAQIPLLNDKQLVARWRQEMPPTFVSDAQVLPVDPLPSGLYLVEATDGHYKAYTILMVSEMALITRTTSGSVLAYCVDRRTGTPIAGAKVRLGVERQELVSAQTGSDGLAELHATTDKRQADNIWVIATTGKEVAVVTPGGYAFSASASNKYASYVYTDRPVYRPGHTVHWKAIVRERINNHLELPKSGTMRVLISDDQDHPVFDKEMPVSASGSISGDLTLAANASLGYYSIRIGEAESGISGDFHVEEYRKPEYQVRVSAAKPRLLQGESMQVVIDSRYFFGEPVANAKVKYRVYHSPHYWWDDEDEGQADTTDGEESNDTSLGYGADQQSEKTGRLDANGKLTITVPTQIDPSERQKRDQDYTIEAGVTDEANREITGRGHFLATVGSFRIHVEPASYAVRAGESAKFDVTAVDYDSKPVQTKVHLQLITRHWASGGAQMIKGAAIDVATDAAGKAQGIIPVQSSGSLEVEATATTPEQRVVSDSSWLWVMGTGEADWGEGSRGMQIVADKKTYAPGDTAHLSIISEVEGFHALVVAAGNSIEFKKVMSSEGRTLTFDLPITTDSQPNLEIGVVVLKNDQLYEATKQIKVPPAQEQLQVVIAPVKEIFQPEQAATYDVFTRDYMGKPVSADFSFGVVDEAIYSIHPDSSGDMVKGLYPNRYVYAAVDSSLQYYFSGEAGTKSPLLADRQSRYRPQLAQVKPGIDVQPKVRKAFPDTAFWSPSVHTDAQGHARVSLIFPDSLTTWRTTVRAITLDSKAGSAVNRVIVRKNIIVRMGSPRFMRKGDELTVPVIVHNYLEQTKQVRVSLDISGLDSVAGSPQEVTVPSKGDATVLWRVKASQIRTAHLLAKALTNEESDAIDIVFPVEAVGVPQTINGTGAISETSGQASTIIEFPSNTDPAAYRMHIEVSPSIAGSLFSALDYLTTYPYGCTEQTMSSFLPNIIVAETLKKVNISARVNAADLNAKIAAGVDRLNDYQHDDGGWGWWKEDESRVFMTAYVVSGLAEAKHAGYLRDASHINTGIGYLQKQLAEHPRMLPELRAYVAYSLSEAEASGGGESLDVLWSRRNDLSAEGLALTGLAMLRSSDKRAPEIAKLLESKAQHAGTLTFWPSNYNPLLDLSYNNDAESTAFALRFLTRIDPQSPLLGQAAQWLVVNRSGGYWWESTEQTAMVLFGLVDYLAASQELNADFDVEVLLNGGSIGKRHFTSADATAGVELQIDAPVEKLQARNTVQVLKHGSGVAYWTSQGSYFSTERKLYQQGTMSLNLTRDYFKLVATQKDGQILYRLDPLNGPVAPGDILAVHLAVNGSSAKYLLLEDPIPAGTEFLEHEDSYKILDRPGTWSYWYTRREFHDDRAAIFATEFSGRQESFYLLKVVNPGSFVISPAHVEPMYQPGIQATSDALHLQVDAPSSEVKR
jgi:alpha-2-macroglobulin